jgi:hypothetical protein
MTFCAFSIEAYLNHLGSELIHDWDTIERKINHREKIKKIFNALNREYDETQKPFCYINNIYYYRNEIVHANTRKFTEKKKIGQNGIPDMPLSEWETMTNLDRAAKFLKDTKDIIVALSELSGDSDFPLASSEDASWCS